eukprot:bmy_11387T0
MLCHWREAGNSGKKRPWILADVLKANPSNLGAQIT